MLIHPYTVKPFLKREDLLGTIIIINSAVVLFVESWFSLEVQNALVL